MRKNLLAIYIVIVVVSAILLFIISWPNMVWSSTLWFFLLLTWGAEALPVRLPRGDGSVSVGFAVIYSAVLIFGTAEGMILAVFGTIIIRELKGEIPFHIIIFNRAQLAVSAGLSGVVYYSIVKAPLTELNASLLLGVFLGGLTYMLVNTTSATLYLALAEKVRFVSMWFANTKWMIPNYLALIPLAYLIAIVFENTGLPGLLLLFIPLLLARHAFQRYMDMREVYISTISTLTRALEAKDAYTYGHGDRVSILAKKIGRKMNMSENDVEILGYVGVLHDIGKIGVKDGILNKPGPFTSEEFREMKKHPEIGAEILQGVSFLGNGAKWVKHHHERLNGEGYPDGLKGDSIPLGAKIIAVADAFDAMMSDRSYKNAGGLEFAMKELEANKGTQFDGKVVEAFKAVLEDPDHAKEILERRIPVDRAVVAMAAATGEE